MNSKPQIVEVRDGREAGEMGKELGHAHRLMCRLRHAGATRGDLVKMREVDLTIFGEFIAKVRGLRIPGEEHHDSRIVNLDYEPGFPVPLSDFSGRDFTKKIEVVRDDRMGIWLVIQEDRGYIFGDMEFTVEKPAGTCVQGRNFCSGNLVNFSDGKKNLNLAMAVWFSQNSCIDVPFDSKLFVSNKGNSIFFLGTVWWDQTSNEYLGPALVSYGCFEDHKIIRLEIKPIPDGDWPGNCYVALLIPR